jgi:hypothetical protein
MKQAVACAVLIGILVTAVVSVSAEMVYPDRRVLLPYQSVAAADGLWALRYNPGTLAADNDWRTYVAHTYSDSDLAGNDLIYVGRSGFAFGVEWLGSGGEPDARHHTLGWGGEIKDRIYLGASYRWVTSDDVLEDKAHFWTYALMVRPGEHLSLGVRLENANHMPYAGERTAGVYAYSAAVNMFDERLVLGADYYQSTGQRLADGAYHLTAGLELVDGLIISGDYGDKGRPLYGGSVSSHKFGLGVQLNLAELMLSSYNAFDRDGKFFRGTLAAGSFKERRRSVVHLRREVADISLSGAPAEKQSPRFFLFPGLGRITKSSPF